MTYEYPRTLWDRHTYWWISQDPSRAGGIDEPKNASRTGELLKLKNRTSNVDSGHSKF